MKVLKVLTILLLCIVPAMSAQEITGRIVDENHQAIKFANVILISDSDSTFISGTVSGQHGEFRITAPAEKSLIRVSVIGFVPKTVSSVPLGGEIVLQQDIKTLGTITAKGRRPTYLMGKEGLVANFAGTSLNLAGSIMDILKYVPGMVITNEGINVFGKGTPLIYINDRQIRNSEELKRINSNQVKDVEVIHNPGPEYPSDTRAVVKIRLLKPKGEGLGIGFVGTYAQSENSDYSTQIEFSYNKKGLYAFGLYKWSHDKVLQKGCLQQTVYADPLWEQTNELDNQVVNNNHDLTAGVDYMISKKHSVGVRYIASFNGHHCSDLLTYTKMTANGQAYDELATHTWTKYDNRPKHQLNAYYNGMLGKTSVNMNVDYFFNNNKNTQHNDETSISHESREITSTSSVRNNMVAAKLIVGNPLFGGTLRSGVEVVANNRHDDYTIDQTDILSNSAGRLKEFQVSPFLEYQYRLSFGRLNAGVRFEHVSFKHYENATDQPSQSHHFNNLFPTLSLTTNIGKTSLNIGYSVKTKRPTYRQLSNNIIYINRFSMQSGNPNLGSEHIHAITAMVQWKFIQAMAGWQDDRDAIIYWAEQMPENTSVTTIKYKNQNSVKSFDAMIAAAPSFGLWNPRFTVGIRKQWLDLKTMMGTFKMNKPMLNVLLANIIRLPWDMIANVDISYLSKGTIRIYIPHETYSVWTWESQSNS